MKLKPEIGGDENGLEITRYCLAGAPYRALELEEDEISLVRAEREKLQFWQDIFKGTASDSKRSVHRGTEEHHNSGAEK